VRLIPGPDARWSLVAGDRAAIISPLSEDNVKTRPAQE
jgi:hypothetical protein